MAQTSKTITTAVYEAVRTNMENGDKWIVLLVTYSDASQERLTFPVPTAIPV